MRLIVCKFRSLKSLATFGNVNFSTKSNINRDSPNQIKSSKELVERIRKKQQLMHENRRLKLTSRKNNNQPVVDYSLRSHYSPKISKIEPQPNVKTIIDDDKLEKIEKLHLKNLESDGKRPENKRSIQSLIVGESEFLQHSSLRSRNEQLDQEGKQLLDGMDSLKKSSIDPKHLTILHQTLASRTSSILVEQLKSNKSSVFVELNPGLGIITKNLISQANKENLHIDRFILLESFGKNFDSLQDLKSISDRVTILKQKPFDQNFLYSQTQTQMLSIINNIKKPDLNLTIFGILPWNTKGFI